MLYAVRLGLVSDGLAKAEGVADRKGSLKTGDGIVTDGLALGMG
jgi:hypothetical protein